MESSRAETSFQNAIDLACSGQLDAGLGGYDGLESTATVHDAVPLCILLRQLKVWLNDHRDVERPLDNIAPTELEPPTCVEAGVCVGER